MGAVAVLADDLGAVREPGVDEDGVALGEAVGPLPERGDDARPVGAEDARLGNGRQALPDPEVEVVERRRLQPDEDLAGPRLRILDVLVPQDLGAAVLVDPNRLHGRDRNLRLAVLP